MSDDYVHTWLEIAHSDAKAAMTLAGSGNDLQALFFVQQSIEKATKAMLLAKGARYTDVRSDSHNNLYSFLSLSKELIGTHFVAETLQHLFDEDVFSNLVSLHTAASHRMRRRRKKQAEELLRDYRELFSSLDFSSIESVEYVSFRAQMATLPPEVVELLLDMLSGIRDTVVSATKGKFTIGALPSDTDPLDWLQSELASQIFSRNPNHPPRTLSESELGVVRAFIDLIGESQFRQALASPREAQVGLQFKWTLAFINLYIIGVLAWPHAVSARYPAPPNVSGNTFQAAKDGQMGSKHYTFQTGAIRHAEALANKAEWTTKILLRCHRRGIRIYPHPDILGPSN